MTVEGPVEARAQHTDEQLALLAQAGDGRAADLLARRYLDHAYTIANVLGYSTPLNGRDDIRQEALHGLYGAIRAYRPDRGTTFKSFATMCIRRWLYTVLKTDTRAQRYTVVGPLRLDAPLADQDGGLSDDELDLHDKVADPRSDVVDLLTGRERLALVGRVVRAELSPLEQACVRMFAAGASYPEIDAALAGGIDDRPPSERAQATPVKVVDNALTRARRKIAARLEDEGLAA